MFLKLNVSAGPHIQAMLTSCRFFQCNFSTFLSIYSPSYNCYPDFQISWLLQGYCPANTHPDPAMKLVFLAHCFEHTGSLYPLHHQFPPLLWWYSISFPDIISDLLSKHQCLSQQDHLPPSFPPLLTCLVLLQAFMCWLCWKKFLPANQNAPFSSLKHFWATSSTLTPITSLGQESGWDAERK